MGCFHFTIAATYAVKIGQWSELPGILTMV